MRLSRRPFLGGLAAAALPFPAFAENPEILEPRPTRVQHLPEGYPDTELWLFNGRSPGPEIRVPQGGLVERRLVNSLPQPTSIHWHGIRIENAMDGVPDMTQMAVPPGESFDYAFTAPDAGTYWYHSHMNSVEQVARGLYGPLIVEEAEGPDVDRDLTLVLADWRVDREGVLAGQFDSPMDRSHAGRVGAYPTTNGKDNPAYPAGRHERLRLRLINASNARIFELTLQGLEGWIVALDGQPLETPGAVPDRLFLAPAQRADLIVDVTAEEGEEAFLVSIERDGGYAQATFPVGPAVSASRRDAPAALPPNDLPAIGDLASVQSVPLLMEGGAMGGMRSAMFDGAERDMRAIAQENMFWAFNGQVGMTDTPLVDAARGETVRVAMKNDTAWPHGMHLHGHHFREVMGDGSLGPWRDTLLMDRGEAREIAFVADNPGVWLLHCHMLSHQAAGMKTWIRVAA